MNQYELYTAPAEIEYRREKTARSLHRGPRRWPRIRTVRKTPHLG